MGKTTTMPFTGPSYDGRPSTVNAQQCINLIFNVDNQSGKSVLSLMNRHCLEDFCDLGQQAIRGEVSEGDYGYVVSGSKFYRISNAGDIVEKGTLLTNAGICGMASNGFDIFITDGTYGYNYKIATDAFTQDVENTVAGAGFTAANCVTFIDQYFVCNRANTGIAECSAMADGTTWNALDVATIEGDPDNLVRAIAVHGDLWMLGGRTAEPYYNAANATGFPFSRKGQGYIDMGIVARWSAAAMDNTLYWLAQNREGYYGVCRASGNSPQKISTPAIDYQINQMSLITDAIAFSFADEGHSYYVITFPTGNKTFVYDAATSLWGEWQSHGVGRFKVQHHMMIAGSHIVGGDQDGKLYKLKQGVYSDAGETVDKIRTTQFLHKSGREITINKLWIDFEVGTGLQEGQGSDPMVMLQFSKDGGKTWSNEYWKSIGKVGKYGTRVTWTRLGSAYTWAFRLKISDSVKVVIVGAFADIDIGDN